MYSKARLTEIFAVTVAGAAAGYAIDGPQLSAIVGGFLLFQSNLMTSHMDAVPIEEDTNQSPETLSDRHSHPEPQ